MNTIANINIEKGLTHNTKERTTSAVAQDEPNTKTSRKDTFEFSDCSQSNSVVYSRSIATTTSTSASSGIYDSANYYSTSISLSQMAMQRVNIDGSIGSGAVTGAAYAASLAYLQNFTPIETYNHYSEGNIGRGSVEDTIFTYDHQYFLYSLTNKYESSTKNYYAARGYKIDAYLLMGIAYGESEALKSRTNPFGEASSLDNAAVEKAKTRAVQALRDCGLAKDESAARTMMASDPFYEKAARVLSYMDNGKTYNTPLNVNYGCLDDAMPNIERWRNAVASGSQNRDDYGYRWHW